MADKNTLSQMLEHLVNGDQQKAEELFHEYVVAQSRDIYESLIESEMEVDEEVDDEETDGEDSEGNKKVDESGEDLDEDGEDLDENFEDLAIEGDDEMGGDATDDLAGELDGEEGDMDDMDMDSEEDHHADVGGEEELEDRVVDLESALDELKAEFDALMAGEESEEEAMPGIHGDDDGDVEVGNEEFYEAEHKEEDAEELDEAKHEEDEEAEEVDETIVREYVEKVATPANSEGAAVGAGKSVAVNKKSTVAGKNDMGGTAAFSKGGNADQDGNRPTATEKPKGTLVSNPQNKPGANAGKAFAKKETAVNAEVGGVNKTSPLAK